MRHYFLEVYIMQEERDNILVLTDEDGNDVEVEILDYFFYNGEEYCMVAEVKEGCDCGCEDCDHDHDECDCDDEECTCGEPVEVFFMKAEAVDDENEEYTVVDDAELAQQLIAVVESDLDEDEEE